MVVVLLAAVLNALLLWTLMHMATSAPEREWIVSTGSDVFDFANDRARREEADPRRPPPPKPAPLPSEPFSDPLSNATRLPEALTNLPLPVPQLRLELAPAGASGGPALPRLLVGGPGNGDGRGLQLAIPDFVMADELTAIARMQPTYPDALRFRRVEGEVLVEFTVDPSGKVLDPEVIASSPAGTFDQAALRAIRGWRFVPERDDQGQAIAVRARQQFRFRLNQ